MSALSFNQYFLNVMHERWWEDEEWKWWRRREKVKKNEGCEYSSMLLVCIPGGLYPLCLLTVISLKSLWKNKCKLAQNLVYKNENGHIICDSFVSKEVNSKGERRRASNKQSKKKIKVHENGHQSSAENSSEAVNVCTKYTGIYKWKGAQSHHKNITSHNCGYQKGMCPDVGPCPWPVFERNTQLLPYIPWRHTQAEVIIWWGNFLSGRYYEFGVI